MKNETSVSINNLSENEENINKLINNKRMKKFVNIFISVKVWIEYLYEEIRLYFSLILIQHYELMIYFIIILYLNT
jgi:hypothetical protein